jgi:inhibitor of the pro-sigma K processing machinery
MDNYMGVIIITVVLAMVILVIAMRKKSEIIINFMLRAVVGTLAIYFINQFIAQEGISVGINPITVIGSGLLGLPGVALFYGIDIYKQFF